jgi:hypothetical protein
VLLQKLVEGAELFFKSPPFVEWVNIEAFFDPSGHNESVMSIRG